MGKLALVTGASSGLGEELAKLFAADGWDLLLVARRKDLLDALAAELVRKHGIAAHVLVADLGTLEGPAQVVADVQAKQLEVEALVNNAGYGDSGAFVASDAAKQLGMVQLNMGALVSLTRAFLPGMVARKRGHVLNIGSTAGFQPGPYMAVYYASKAFVNSFTEALSYELKGTGVTATVSCPGATATGFSTVAGTSKSRLFKSGAMEPGAVARDAYRACLSGRAMVVHGVKNKLAAFSVRFTPRGVIRAVAAALNRA